MPMHDAQVFHAQALPLYAGEREAGGSVKRAAALATVRYAPAHPNPQQPGSRAGQGENLATWLAGEQRELGPQAEGWSAGSLSALIDSRLAPQASVGWHEHRGSEEFYWLLEGSLLLQLRLPDGSEHAALLQPGDVHRCPAGGAHSVQAGPEGARFLAVELKA